MIRTASRNLMGSIGQLPGNKEPPLAAHLHPFKTLVKAGKGSAAPAHALSKFVGLRVAECGLSIRTQHWLAILVFDRLPVIVGGVEFDSGRFQPAGVQHRIELARLGIGAGAYLDLLVLQGKCRLHDALHRGNSRCGNTIGQLGCCCRRMGGCRAGFCCRCRLGRFRCGFGGGLGADGHRAGRQDQDQSCAFHSVVRLQKLLHASVSNAAPDFYSASIPAKSAVRSASCSTRIDSCRA